MIVPILTAVELAAGFVALFRKRDQVASLGIFGTSNSMSFQGPWCRIGKPPIERLLASLIAYLS